MGLNPNQKTHKKSGLFKHTYPHIFKCKNSMWHLFSNVKIPCGIFKLCSNDRKCRGKLFRVFFVFEEELLIIFRPSSSCFPLTIKLKTQEKVLLCVNFSAHRVHKCAAFPRKNLSTLFNLFRKVNIFLK